MGVRTSYPRTGVRLGATRPGRVPLLLLLAACDPTAGDEASPAICSLVTTDRREAPGELGDGTYRDQTLYDAESRPLWHEADIQDDGLAWYHDLWTYDAAGDPETWVWFYGWEPPGFQRSATAYTYDDAHELLVTEEDSAEDGTVERRGSFTWEDARIVAETQEDYGEPWYTGTRDYDADGQLTRRRLDYANGKDSFSWEYTWVDGNAASETYDAGAANGTPERVTWWSYDERAHVVLEEIDDASAASSGGGADGVVDRRYARTWEGDELVTLEAQGADGTVFHRTTYSYDAQARVVLTVEEAVDAEGLAMEVSRTTHAYEDAACS